MLGLTSLVAAPLLRYEIARLLCVCVCIEDSGGRILYVCMCVCIEDSGGPRWMLGLTSLAAAPLLGYDFVCICMGE